jgi:hypothetical protein
MRDNRSEQVMLIVICTTTGLIGLVYVAQLLM